MPLRRPVALSNVDEIMLELSQDVCSLFNADRLTIYSIGEDKASIVSKVKTGLNSFKDLKLPIADQSIAGHVARLHDALVRRGFSGVEVAGIMGENFLRAFEEAWGS